MVFLMGFEGVDRIQLVLREECKELIKIEASFSDRKMFIQLPVIVMEVNLVKIFSQCFNPGAKKDFAENMMMACIETEPEVERLYPIQES
jgi:hypothetical protein